VFQCQTECERLGVVLLSKNVPVVVAACTCNTEMGLFVPGLSVS
jgi:hypothetical protein